MRRLNGKPDWAIGANIYIKAEDEDGVSAVGV
jgi:hypothetical protein